LYEPRYFRHTCAADLARSGATKGPMSDSPDIVTRMQELEIKAMEQQRLLAELSEVIYAQQRELDEISQRVHRLGQKLAADPGLVDRNQDDKPPHY
jgi:uncharacterized coiled-coil protein SlyX